MDVLKPEPAAFIDFSGESENVSAGIWVKKRNSFLSGPWTSEYSYDES